MNRIGTETHETLVSQAIMPLFESESPEQRFVVGEPCLPGAFRWKGDTFPVLKLIASGKGLGPCSHGSGERYVQKHWYRFESTGQRVMRVYFERRSRSGAKARWWLYSILSIPGSTEEGVE